jgi:hypothetical protein
MSVMALLMAMFDWRPRLAFISTLGSLLALGLVLTTNMVFVVGSAYKPSALFWCVSVAPLLFACSALWLLRRRAALKRGALNTSDLDS